jgi:hypothetical protein
MELDYYKGGEEDGGEGRWVYDVEWLSSVRDEKMRVSLRLCSRASREGRCGSGKWEKGQQQRHRPVTGMGCCDGR